MSDIVRCVRVPVATMVALADPVRGRIVEALARGELRTSDLAARVGVSVPALSRHLRLLRAAGVVARQDVDEDGRGRLYQLRPEVFATIGEWGNATSWAQRLQAGADDHEAGELLGRMGAFLDAFAAADRAFFEAHLRDDAVLVFPDSDIIDKAGCLEAVEGHPPWMRQEPTSVPVVQHLGASIRVITYRATVRHADDTDDRSVHIGACFCETDPWQIAHLQWTPAPNGPDSSHPHASTERNRT